MTPPYPVELESLLSERTWLVRLSRMLVRQAADADDVVQETYLRALAKRRNGFRGDERPEPRGWLSKTARNIVHESSRARRHRGDRELAAAVPDVSDAPEPDDVLAKNEFRLQVSRAVLDLDPDERIAVTLRYYEDLSAQEIGARTGVDEATARKRVSRGLARIRRRLDTESGGDWLPVAVALSGASFPLGASTAVSGATWLVSLALLLTATLGAVLLGIFDRVDSDESSSGFPAPAVAGAVQLDRPAGIQVAVDLDEGALGGGAERTEVPMDPATPPSTEVRVTITDGAGVPIGHLPWFVIRTGQHDFGRSVGLAGESPNPAPSAEGVTDMDGVARFPRPADPVVHLCVARNDTHARGGWPIHIEGDTSYPDVVVSNTGRDVDGRVVDESGHPLRDVAVLRRGYGNELELLARTRGDGTFTLPRLASFPRRFMMNADDELEATTVQGESLALVQGSIWDQSPARARESGKYLTAAAEDIDRGRLPDLVLESLVTYVGRVVDGSGQGIAGALVSTELHAISLASGSAYDGARHLLPWEAGGTLLLFEALTDDHGAFRISGKADRVQIHGLVAILPSGASSTEPLGRLAPGTTSEPITVVVDEAKFVHLKIMSRQSEDGSLPIPTSLAHETVDVWWDTPTTPGIVRGRSSSHTLPPDQRLTFRRSWVSGSKFACVRVPGYEVALVDFGQDEQELAVEVDPLPKLQVRVRAAVEATGGHGEPAQFHLAISTTPPKADASGRTELASRLPVGEWIVSIFQGSFGDWYETVRPRRQDVWIHVLPATAEGRAMGSVEVFGPYARGISEIDLTLSALPEIDPADALRAQSVCVFRLRAVDAVSGESVAGVHLEAANGDLRSSSRASEDDGVITFQCHPGGSLLTLLHALYEPTEIGTFAFEAGQDIDHGDVDIQRLKVARGRIVNAEGSPIAERRWIYFNDGALGRRSWATERDGTFEFGFKNQVPVTAVVEAPQGRGGAGAIVRLLPSGDDGLFELELPEWRQVQVEVEGLDLADRIVRTYLTVESTGGGKVKAWHTGIRGESAVYAAWFPPPSASAGPWTLTSGPEVRVPELTFEVPSSEDEAPLIIRRHVMGPSSSERR